MSMFLVTGRAARSLGSVRSTRWDWRRASREGPACDLNTQAALVPEPGSGRWAMQCVGSTKGQVVTVGRWFELDMEGGVDRASSWGRVDAGRPQAGRRSVSKAKGGGGFGQGRPSVLAHARPQSLRGGHLHFCAISFDSQSLCRVMSPGSWPPVD